MTTKAEIQDFLSQKTLAIVGVSRNHEKFGNAVYRELKTKGYRLFPINPNAETIEGDPCYPNLESLPEPVGGAIIIVPKSEVENVVKDAKKAGISRVWIQQMAETEAAIKYCEENGIAVVHNECIMMFSEPTAFFHKFHRWIWGLAGKLPK